MYPSHPSGYPVHPTSFGPTVQQQPGRKSCSFQYQPARCCCSKHRHQSPRAPARTATCCARPRSRRSSSASPSTPCASRRSRLRWCSSAYRAALRASIARTSPSMQSTTTHRAGIGDEAFLIIKQQRIKTTENKTTENSPRVCCVQGIDIRTCERFPAMSPAINAARSTTRGAYLRVQILVLFAPVFPRFVCGLQTHSRVRDVYFLWPEPCVFVFAACHQTRVSRGFRRYHASRHAKRAENVMYASVAWDIYGIPVTPPAAEHRHTSPSAASTLTVHAGTPLLLLRAWACLWLALCALGPAALALALENRSASPSTPCASRRSRLRWCSSAYRAALRASIAQTSPSMQSTTTHRAGIGDEAFLIIKHRE